LNKKSILDFPQLNKYFLHLMGVHLWF